MWSRTMAQVALCQRSLRCKSLAVACPPGQALSLSATAHPAVGTDAQLGVRNGGRPRVRGGGHLRRPSGWGGGPDQAGAGARPACRIGSRPLRLPSAVVAGSLSCGAACPCRCVFWVLGAVGAVGAGHVRVPLALCQRACVARCCGGARTAATSCWT